MDNANSVITKYQNGLGIDNKLKLKTGSVSKYFLQDHLGSTTALTNSSGSIIESATYDSFGNATGNLSTRYQFTGREFDADLGLQYSRARWYDATLGRFISEDPIGFRGKDINLYGYVRSNPVNFKDPTGKIILPVLIVGGAIAAEVIFHLYLGSEAGKIPWKDGDGYGRKKHCWVNCISTRVHLGSPMVVSVAGIGQEGVNILQYLNSYIGNGNSQEFSEKIQDSMGDMRANQQGQMKAFIIWKGCQELCEDCQ